ncbi:ATP-binding cassette domain-containing protein [Microbacterium sp. CIAB417]|uniref:ATP-binding cassette domain-containing protein n=1 Tax=Microbacterium sp. CIAB417 TaxID=2860287 RepID=UPI001FAE05C6|nr:ATP-binding cassette domain-containing protein [Microbacterium sp. CIAB417]
MLSARGLTLRHGRRVIFQDLSFTLGRGITALLGPNGAGKTTLLEALAKPTRAANGEVLLDGDSATDSAAAERAFLRRSGFMPQHWQFFPGFTARESVQYVAWLKEVPRGLRSSAVTEALATVDLVEKQDERVAKFSGGMRQRVGLAEALVNQPAVLLLDEPTVGLDPEQRSTFRRALQRDKDERITLLSTHLTDDVAAIADRVLVVAQGALLFDGSPAELALRGGSSGMTPSPLEDGYLTVLAQHGASAA